MAEEYVSDCLFLIGLSENEITRTVAKRVIQARIAYASNNCNTENASEVIHSKPNHAS